MIFFLPGNPGAAPAPCPLDSLPPYAQLYPVFTADPAPIPTPRTPDRMIQGPLFLLLLAVSGLVCSFLFVFIGLLLWLLLITKG